MRPSFVRSRRAGAFSLIELLVVVAIIALLISVLVPGLAAARRSAREVACKASLHTMGLGAHYYETVSNGFLPWEGYAEGDRPVRHLGVWEDPSQWFNAIPAGVGLQPYVRVQDDDAAGRARLPHAGDRSIFVCTEAQPAVAGPQDDLVVDGCFMLWGLTPDGTHLDRRKTYWSFGYNTELDSGIEDRHAHRQILFNWIKNTAETPLIVEKLMQPDEFDPPFFSSVGQAAVSWKEFTTRHRGGGFLLMVDGHAAYFRRRDLLSAPGAPEDFNQPGVVVWNPGGVAN